MKKVWLILGVVVAMVALGMGTTSAFAQDNGNGGTSGSLFCNEWLLGEIQGDPTGNVINLLPRGEDTPVGVSVNEDTKYRALMAAWQEVTFDSLADGDWIALCRKDGLAKVVILLEAPQKPYHLTLVGNVTEVNGEQITVGTGEGNTVTIDLSNSGVDTTGIEVGQSVGMTISECRPLHGTTDFEGMLQRFRQRFENWQDGVLQRFRQRFENWQDQNQGMLQRFRQRFENWQDQNQGMLQRFKQRFENWQDRFGDEAQP